MAVDELPVDGFTNNTYECVGGPNDGEIITLQEGKRSLTISAPLIREPGGPDSDVNVFKVRTGFYKVKRHPTKGYVLSWIGWVENK